MKKLLFTLVLFLWTPLVHAQCDYTRGAELSKLASNVKISYTYDTSSNFNVVLTNITNDIYVTDNYGTQFYNFESNKTYYSGEKLSFSIYSNDNNCKGELLLTKYLSLPSYNVYYNTAECAENPDFKYCQKWGDLKLKSGEFDTALTAYKTANELKNTTIKLSLWDAILNVYDENKPIIIFSFALIILLIVAFIFKRR